VLHDTNDQICVSVDEEIEAIVGIDPSLPDIGSLLILLCLYSKLWRKRPAPFVRALDKTDPHEVRFTCLSYFSMLSNGSTVLPARASSRPSAI
jgi:hypothetical protein